MRFDIGLKDSCVVQAALQTMRSAQAFDRIRFTSSSAHRLAMLRRQEPQAMTSLGASDVLGLTLRNEATIPSSQTHWGWTCDRVNVIQVPENYHDIPVITRRSIAPARTADLGAHVRTINDPERMHHLTDLNTGAIMTNVPSLALKTLG